MPPQAPRPAAAPDLSRFVAQLHGLDYLPLNTLCQELRFRWNWEPGSQVAQVTTGSAVIRLAPGLSVALVNGVPQPLGAPVVLHDGIVWIPARALLPWATPVPPMGTVPPGGMYAIRTVVLDAGHGGRDAGAVGAGGIREKDVVLDITRRLRSRLEAEGIKVIMTRSDDRFISLGQRAALANRHHADLFVSIHANASRARGASGYEVYYLSEATDDAARALAVAENAALELETGPRLTQSTEAIVWDLLNTENRTTSRELAAVVCRGMRQFLPADNRGVKSARFYVLKWTQMPAILVEVGFVTNRTEGQRLRVADYRQHVSDGIAHGLLAYKSLYERTNGFSS